MPAAGTTLSDAINMHPKDDGGGMWWIAVRRKRVRWMWRHDRLSGELSERRGLQPWRQSLLHPKDDGGGMWRIAVRRRRVQWVWRHDRLPRKLPERRGLQR